MGKRACLAEVFLLGLFLAVPLAWALDTGANDVNLNNFERPLLGRYQTYFNLNSGITWHRERTMHDFEMQVFVFRVNVEKKVRDNWHQWDTGGELGFGLTDKITARVWGDFNFPAGSHQGVSRESYNPLFYEMFFSKENSHRWRKSESFGAEINYRPFPNWEFYATTNGSASWFREEIGYNFVLSVFPILSPREKVLVRERNFNQELLAGFKYLFEMPAYDKNIASLDLRRSPQPKVVDLVQWDRALLHMGQFMVNPYGGVRFVDQRRTIYQRYYGRGILWIGEFDLPLNETRNWPLWTHNETARDVYAQGIIGANAAVGITDSLLLEGGYKHYLPVSYKRNVTRKFQNSTRISFFDEDDHGQNEGWAGNAKLTYRFNPWFQVYTGYTGWSDHSQFYGSDLSLDTIGGDLSAEKGEFDRRLAEHRVLGGFTFLTPVKGEANPAPINRRTLNDWQRPLLRPLQFGANLYGGWRYVKDVFITGFETRPINFAEPKRKSRTQIDRSFAQGFVGGDIYFGILEGLQFDTSAHFYAPARYCNRVSKTPTTAGSTPSVGTILPSRFPGEEVAWDVSPRFTYRPWPNFEAFLGANFGQVRTVRNQEIKEKIGSFPVKIPVEFTKTETIYNVNAGVKILF